jgi:hypothetical protein
MLVSTLIFVIKKGRYILTKNTVYKLFNLFENVSFPFPFSLGPTANEN